VKALIESKADVVVMDARRFDEYQTMSIPTATSVPGAELVLRARELAPNPKTQIIVNCAGRTRSIIGTQSLVNAGLPNPVAALRNGTIGWKLAGQQLDHGAQRQAPAASEAHHARAQSDARAVAEKAGVHWIGYGMLDSLTTPTRTTYCLDVRTPSEYEAGHLPGFGSAPGGQLVQETDHHAPVRGARIVLADDDKVRAPMSASWLAQMGWEVYVVVGAPAAAFSERGSALGRHPATPNVSEITPTHLAQWLQQTPAEVALIDLNGSANYVKKHIPGAWFAIRAQLAQALDHIPAAARYVLTCDSSPLARFAAQDLRDLLTARGTPAEVHILAGGNAAWFAAGLPAQTGTERLAVPASDRYRRPYEGTDAPASAMQAYLDWEFGLVAQLGRDGTHHFCVI
jgi:rhodanese-related sulfurtransferase